ncbi:MAG: hypothetical protein NTW21_43995, partial [Verrucomicrobia bacterium]|nr:hypothetical protein [Verrucomicrobiota bacterium]
AGSPHRASPWGLLLSAPDWLHVGHLFDMLITFQINREASLGLAHRIITDEISIDGCLQTGRRANQAHLKNQESAFINRQSIPAGALVATLGRGAQPSRW